MLLLLQETDTPSLSLPTLGFLLTNLVDKHRDLLESGSNRTLAVSPIYMALCLGLGGTVIFVLDEEIGEVGEICLGFDGFGLTETALSGNYAACVEASDGVPRLFQGKRNLFAVYEIPNPHFQEKADENDGIVDSLATRGTESLIVGTCVDLSLKCISDYLAWYVR